MSFYWIFTALGESSAENGFKSHLEELSTLIIDNPSNEPSMENQKVKVINDLKAVL